MSPVDCSSEIGLPVAAEICDTILANSFLDSISSGRFSSTNLLKLILKTTTIKMIANVTQKVPFKM